MKSKPYEAPIIPHDPTQCQAEKPNGHNFMTFGGKPGLKRCENKPLFVATETLPAMDGKRGSMSLCAECRTILEEQGHPFAFEITPLEQP